MKKYLSAYFLEWRTILSYRFSAWADFFGSIIGQMIISYCLWAAVFSYRDIQTLNGMKLNDLLFYYLIAASTWPIVSGKMINFMTDDIYLGGLNKYLLYPLDYFKFKSFTQFAHTTFHLFQFFISIIIFSFIFKISNNYSLGLFNISLFIISSFLCSYLYYAMATCLEQASFWADNVWSLVVLMKYSIFICGGYLIPLSFYPEAAVDILFYVPLTHMISLPISTLKTDFSMTLFLQSLSITMIWSLFFTFLSKFIWHRGVKNYSGVGI